MDKFSALHVSVDPPPYIFEKLHGCKYSHSRNQKQAVMNFSA